MELSANSVRRTLQLRALFGPHWSKVTPIEREVIEVRYGLVNGVSHTIQEVANWLGLSMSKAYRLQKSATAKLLASDATLPLKGGV